MRYHNITKDDMLNGEGLRVVLWVAGCSHHCFCCHNPVTWDIEGGVEFDNAAKEEIWAELAKPYIQGITFSGGDPLHLRNREEVGSLIKAIRKDFPTKTIWLYTGYRYEEVSEWPALKEIDVLVDGRFVQTLKDENTPWVGSTNQRIIDMKKTILTKKICCR